MKKTCWVITGAGHFLKEVVELLPGAGAVDIFITRAAREVMARYGVMKAVLELEKGSGGAVGVFFETDYSSQMLVRFSSSRYTRLVIAPATSNTVAKCVLGISDSLASNFFAQAGKSRVPITVLPTDIGPDMSSVTPTGRTIGVYPRAVDLEHTRRLAEFEGVAVVTSPEELRRELAQ